MLPCQASYFSLLGRCFEQNQSRDAEMGEGVEWVGGFGEWAEVIAPSTWVLAA